jgi:hypothetical protein
MLRLILALFLALPCFGQIALSYLQSGFDETDLSTYTFASQNLGTADSNRYIVVAVYGRRIGGSVTSVTVNGVSGTEIADVGTSNNYTALYIAHVPTGTTGDIVIVVAGGNAFRLAYSAYRLVANSITVTASQTDITSTFSQDVNVEAGGAVVAAICSETGGGTVTWSGVTEDADAAPGTSFNYSAASDEFATAQTPLSVTATLSSGTTAALIVASFEYVASSTRRIMVIN